MPAKKKIYKLPTYLAPREKNNKHKYKYIPKKIFQTGETNEVTKGMYDAVHTWIDKNLDWEYHFFDKTARRDFIKKYFSKKALDAYDTLIPGTYKADFWRYCVLYTYGGLYIDSKIELLASGLNDVIPKDIEFLSAQEVNPLNKLIKHQINGILDLRILAGFVVAKPKHPFLKKAIDLVIENIDKGYYGYTPVCPTGPRALGRAVQLVLKKNEENPNWVGRNNISGFKFVLWPDILPFYQHLKFSGWLIGSDKNADPILRVNYKNYAVEQLSLDMEKDIGNFYRYAWYMDKIYSHGKILRPKYNSFHKKIIKFDLYKSCLRRLLYSKRYKGVARVIFYSIRKNRFPYFRFIQGVALMIFRKIFRRV